MRVLAAKRSARRIGISIGPETMRLVQVRGDDGRVVVAVPAFSFLWSKHDETFEHYRRYTAARLERASPQRRSARYSPSSQRAS